MRILLVALAVVSACSSIVVPARPDGGPTADGGLRDGPAADAPPQCASRGRRCNGDNDCGACGMCAYPGFRPSGSTMSSTRYLQPGVCVRHHPDTERRCRLDGGVAGLLPGRACAGFRGLGSGFNFASDADDCLLARDIARREARLGEVVGDCWYGDGTLVERGVTTAEPRCIDPSRRLILVTYTCGVGCEACPEQASNCVFQSEVYPTGICMPPTREILGQSLPCHIENPRVLCAPGLACLLPLRNGASGIRDRERWGICMEVRSCNIVAAILRDGYICDNTLMPQ